MSGVPPSIANGDGLPALTNGGQTMAVVGTGDVAALPARLAAVTRPLILTGTTMPPNADGASVIRTMAGEMAIALPQALLANRTVTVRLDPGPQTRATVFAPQPDSPSSPMPAATSPLPTASTATPAAFTVATAANRASPVTAGGTATPVAPPDFPLTVGTIIPAVVLSTPPRPTQQTRTITGKPDFSDTGTTSAKTTILGETDSGSAAPTRRTTRTTTQPPAPDAGRGRFQQPNDAGTVTPGDEHTEANVEAVPTAVQKAAARLYRSAPFASGGEAAPQPSPSNANVPQPSIVRAKSIPTDISVSVAGTAKTVFDGNGVNAPVLTEPSGTGERTVFTAAAAPTAPDKPETLAAQVSDAGKEAVETPVVSTSTPSQAEEDPPRTATPSTVGKDQPKIAIPTLVSEPGEDPSGIGDAAARPSAESVTTPGPLRPGMVVALRILAVGKPSDAVALLPARTADGTVVSGVIAGSTRDGQPVLVTAHGNFALNTTTPLAIGTPVEARAQTPAPPCARLLDDVADPVAPTRKGDDWPALRHLLADLAQINHATAATFVTATIPQPNGKLAAALSFIMTALRGGDAAGWLGDDVSETLRTADRADVVEGFSRSLDGMARETRSTDGTAWTTYSLPFLDASGLKSIGIRVQRPGDEQAGGGNGPRGDRSHRFLVDVELTRLGPMQLDGLVRARRFDLIVRSMAPLALDLRNELTAAFGDAVLAVGYAGTLSCHSGRGDWIDWPADVRRGGIRC